MTVVSKGQQKPETANGELTANFRIGDDSDSDDGVTTESRAVQTEPVDNMATLPAGESAAEPRSLEECLAIFKSDVSCVYLDSRVLSIGNCRAN